MNRRCIVLPSDIFYYYRKVSINEPYLENLPDELLLVIFSYLNASDLFNIMDLNKRMRRLCVDHSLWNEEFMKSIIYRPTQLEYGKSKQWLSKLLLVGLQPRCVVVYICQKWMFKRNNITSLIIDCDYPKFAGYIEKLIYNNANLRNLDMRLISTPNDNMSDKISDIINYLPVYNPNITRLNFTTMIHTTIKIESLIELKSLTELNFGSNVSINYDKSYLLEELKFLTLFNIDRIFAEKVGKTSDFRNIFKLMTEIPTLHLHSNKFDCDIELPNMKKMSISNLGMSIDSLKNWLINCKNLTKLYIVLNYQRSNPDYNIILSEHINLQNLTDLSIHYYRYTNINRSPYELNTDLKINNLLKLTLTGFNIKCTLPKLDNLIELTLDDCIYDQIVVDSLIQFKNLVKFNNTNNFDGIRNLNFSSLSELTKLTELNIDHINDTDEFYLNLPKSLINFTYITNNNYPEDTVNIEGLSSLTQLKQLTISINCIDYDQISKLASLKLQKLDLNLYNCPILLETIEMIFETISPMTELIIDNLNSIRLFKYKQYEKNLDVSTKLF